MQKLFYTILFLYCQVGFAQLKQQATRDSIRISADFDCGSIGKLVESPANVLTGPTLHWKHKTSTDDQYYWFYFRMDHVQGKTVTVKLDHLSGIYRGQPHLIYTEGTRPVYSYDKKNWERITEVSYDSSMHTLTFLKRFAKDSVWLAYAHPYSYERELEFLGSLPKNRRYLQIDTLGWSAQSRPIRLLTITDTTVPAADKKVVLITTLQHAGEAIGGFFVEGMTGYLLSEAATAIESRKKIIYKIVPMMNPDGIHHGMTRLNANYEDLNQEWDDDFIDTVHAPTEPEVASVKNWIRNWLQSGKKIDLALDVHSQGQQGTSNILHAPPGVLNGLAEKLQKYWPVERIDMTFSGSANDCLVKEFQVAAGTFEIPQSAVNARSYLTIDDYHHYGSGTVQGIINYLYPTEASK
ncbi:MAG: M14-type cytosolic carboxypeptidase [Ferruginibacter sp.]